ncbi:MAG: peptidoglycan bridge formation glycyltransferase FemA/FemB family protein [bacterium]
MNNSNQKKEWNQFVAQNKGSFLQSWQWGEFQKSLGRKIWRIQTNKLKGLVLEYDLPFTKKSYLYCPHLSVSKNTGLKEFLNEIRKIAKQEKSIFLKIEPLMDFGVEKSPINMVISSKHIQPYQTLILDISKPENELLNQMHQKTRYNIGLAQKKGVIIEQSENIQDFLKLLEKTSKRDKFYLHCSEYYINLLDILGKDGTAKLFLAKYKDKVIASNVVCFFGKTAIYLYGASDYDFRNLMAPYFLQWHTILRAKKLGYKYYDFWGIDEKRWSGVTRFKKGFNGKEITYPGAFDLVFQPIWYRIYNLVRRVL